MKRLPVLFLICLFLVMTAGTALGQQVEIDLFLSPAIQNARIIYVKSFDMLKDGATEFLFQITINNRETTDQEGRLVFVLNRNEEKLAESSTNNFLLPSGISNLNNLQLANGYTFPQNNEYVKFDYSNTQSPDDDFEKEVGQSGKLPSGTYFLTVSFYPQNNPDQGITASEKMEVIGSAYVFPIAPGTEGGLSNPGIIYTEFPVFQFNTDLYSVGDAQPFNIRVYKVLPDIHLTPDDVLSGTPHLDLNTSYTLFQYPRDGTDDQGGRLQINEFQPLTPGTYLWRVIISLQTNSGTEFIESPIFGFKLVDPNSVSEYMVRQATTMQIFQILRFLIGERANEIENELGDFTLSGIVVDGRTIEMNELYEKINQYTGKVITIENIELRSSQE